MNKPELITAIETITGIALTADEKRLPKRELIVWYENVAAYNTPDEVCATDCTIIDPDTPIDTAIKTRANDWQCECAHTNTNELMRCGGCNQHRYR